MQRMQARLLLMQLQLRLRCPSDVSINNLRMRMHYHTGPRGPAARRDALHALSQRARCIGIGCSAALLLAFCSRDRCDRIAYVLLISAPALRQQISSQPVTS